jgi:hypothetical protein
MRAVKEVQLSVVGAGNQTYAAPYKTLKRRVATTRLAGTVSLPGAE